MTSTSIKPAAQKSRRKKSVFIAIPTYNEAANIEDLIYELQKVAAKIHDWDTSILVIDDKSPDGTANIVHQLQKKYASHAARARAHGNSASLHLLTGPKKGLGAAYTRGITHILTNYNPDYILQMDADFQHSPQDIPRFLSKASRGYQFIIGSRYIAGGDYPNWSFKRKLYSWGANLIARFIAGIYDIEDCTSGFRCISSRFLRSFDLGTLKSDGYAFQMSLLHAASKKRIPIIQIPILFPNRKKGVSKLGHKDIREFFINAVKLRFKRYHWLDR